MDILILSNGPGEITTWVRPVVRALRQTFGEDRIQTRISLVLSPCPNASGREVAIAQTYPEIDRIQAAEHFFPFLLWGKTVDHWDWQQQGVVLFLGGDQFFAVVIGKRLGYRIVVYAEWEARWQRWVDQFGVMNPVLVEKANSRDRDHFQVVGDLMAEVGAFEPIPLEEAGTELIGLLPGSKAAKLAQGVPLSLAIAQRIHRVRPQTRFIIPVAPTLDVATLARFADPQKNPIVQQFGQEPVELVQQQDRSFLKTGQGLLIELRTEFPAYGVLSHCCLCLTTVGANTAELGALAIPMMVLLPTQQLDAMRAWDGLPGLLANLPGLGSIFASLINGWFLRKNRLLAWPNIWAGEAIVPELIGQLDPQQVADFALHFLTHPEQLESMRDRLRSVRGHPGAAQKLAQLIHDVSASLHSP